MPKTSVRKIFEKVDLDRSGQLDIDEFIDFVRLLRER
jgi:Ca2+-binding EF-hand superfamily protein